MSVVPTAVVESRRYFRRQLPDTDATMRAVGASVRRRIAFYGWQFCLALTVFGAYLSGTSGGANHGTDSWPRGAWLALSGAATVCAALAITVPWATRRHHRWIDAVALGTVAALAFARLTFLLYLDAPWAAKLPPMALWSGPLVVIYLYLTDDDEESDAQSIRRHFVDDTHPGT